MKSVTQGQHSFAQAPSIEAPRSVFDMSSGYKTTFNAGELIPFFVEDVIPGDTFNLNTTAFARMSTPIYPLMDNMFMDFHFFFVPLRLVWSNARKFFGEQVNPTDSIDYTLPQFTGFDPAEGSLSDYLGLPISLGNNITPVSIYHRGYNFIYNEWYRDQNLQDSVVVDLDDGPDTITDYVLKKRGKRHDYFTSCLPWPQKGDAVSLPLGTSAIVNVPQTDGQTLYVGAPNVGTSYYSTAAPVTNVVLQTAVNTPNDALAMYADLTNATAATINDLREAFQVQKLLERDARGGTRYSEVVKNHFGVNFYDVSYRPEYLGGGSTPVNVAPVASTSNTQLGTSASIVGSLGAFATAAANGIGFTKSFVEHGFVMGIVSVRADLTYQQGTHRRFLKQTRYDTYYPSLAHLGEQEVTQAELYTLGTVADDTVFGYQERYAEYRYKPSQITGAFRSAAVTPLDAWHLSQELVNPVLGPTFIEEDPPIDRVIAVPSEPHFIFDSYTHFRAARPMPVFGVPGFIDHF